MDKSYYLLVDAGNTFCKYSLFDHQTDALIVSEYFKYCDTIYFKQTLIDFNVDFVLMCSVKNNEFNLQFKSTCLSHWGCQFTLFNPSDHLHLTSKYMPFNSLGADRWASILGVWLKNNSNFCVVDCGTAITVDYVIDNIHLGGLIGPGLNTLSHCLLSNTENININSSSPINKSINYSAISTSECILNASKLYFQSFLDNIFLTNQHKYGKQFTTYLTGGDADCYNNLNNYNITNSKNLILDSLFLIHKKLF